MLTLPFRQACLSVRHIRALYSNGTRYRHNFFCIWQPPPRIWRTSVTPSSPSFALSVSAFERIIYRSLAVTFAEALRWLSAITGLLVRQHVRTHGRASVDLTTALTAFTCELLMSVNSPVWGMRRCFVFSCLQSSTQCTSVTLARSDETDIDVQWASLHSAVTWQTSIIADWHTHVQW